MHGRRPGQSGPYKSLCVILAASGRGLGLYKRNPGAGTGKNKCAIILIEYYNNANYQFKKLLGNISVDDMKVIKNSDNSLDVYIRAVEWYQPLQIQLLSWYGQTNDYPIQTEWIGSSLPTGGIQYSFTDI